MTEAEVITIIQAAIVANGNNEITANVLRPVLIAMLGQPNDKMGELSDLDTTDKSNLVAAINEALANGGGGSTFTVHSGTDNPNTTPPASYSIGDWYIRNGTSIYQYNGSQWVPILNPIVYAFSEKDPYFEATEGQTEFFIDADTVNVDIWVGGIYQVEGQDYTRDEDTITMTYGLVAGDRVTVRQYKFDGTSTQVFNEIDYSNFNYDQHISQNKLKNYLVNNSLGAGFYAIKQPNELSAVDNINLIYNNGEHNGFPSLTKTKEGKLITGYRASPVDHNSPIARAEIMISSDNGNTFGTPIIVDDGSDFTTTDFGIRSCFITQLSTGDLIATYWVNDGSVGNAYIKFSSDGGITWGVRTALIITAYSPNVIGCENEWLEIGGEFILPIFSGSSYSASNAGFVRTSDFISFTYTALDSDDEGTTETRGYIDNSNNTIIFFYQYPVNPNAVLYRSIYDPINNVVISPKTAVNSTDYSSSRSDILFDENRNEMYLLARKPYPQGGKISVSTDKGLNFTDLFDFENLDDRTVYGDFVQVNQSEALFLFATEEVPNGPTSKMWITTFNLSPVQKFSYDGFNVTEINNSYIPKISDFTTTGDNRYVKKAGDVMTGSLQSQLLIAGAGGSAPLRIIGTGVGTASFGQLNIYESDGVTLQAYIGKASGSNGHIYIGSSISGKALLLESGGTLSYNGAIRAAVYTVATLPVGVKGNRAFVSDANASTFNTVAVGGGTNNVPVFHDGTTWRIG